MNVLKKFFLPIFCCKARQLSQISLKIQDHSRMEGLHSFPDLAKALGHISSLRRLYLGLNMHAQELWYKDPYDHIPDSTLCVVTHLELTNNLPLQRIFALMKKCESATFIKIADVDVHPPDHHLLISTLSHISPFRLSSLSALILSIPSLGDQIFNYLDLPNLRLLSITIPAQTNHNKRLFISSLTAYITTSPGIQSLQMLHLDHHGLAVHDIHRFLFHKQVLAIPLLEIFPLNSAGSGLPPITEEMVFGGRVRPSPARRPIESRYPWLDKSFLVEEIQERWPVYVVGWVDPSALEEWEDTLREWGMQLRIVDAYRRRTQMA
jgi:hypothetical protein